MSHDTNRSSGDARRTEGRRSDDSQEDAGSRDGDAQAEWRDAAAKMLGFKSYSALIAASTPITARDGRVHLIVESHDGRWIVWRAETWPEYRTFDSIHHAGRAAGEDSP